VKAKKTDRLILDIEGLASDGQAFVSIDRKKVRVPGFLPGDKVELHFNDEGRIEDARLFEPSPDRVKPDCFFHGPCGG